MLSKNVILIFVLIFFVTTVIDGRKTIYVPDTPLQRIGGRLYKKELLTDSFNSPTELSYDSSSRNLFFMYMDDDIMNSGRALVNVITKEAHKIVGITKNKATAVDPDTSDAYFGSADGLYKYDPILKMANHTGRLYNVNIMKLVIRNNNMYVLDANDHSLYKVFNDDTSAVKIGDWKTVMQFDVDNEGNIHFVNMCGLFCAVKGHETVKNKDLSLVYHFIVDGRKVYGVTEDTIYDIDCRNGTATRMIEMTFFPKSIVLGDYGDVYYSLDDNIYRLRPITSYLVYKYHDATAES